MNRRPTRTQLRVTLYDRVSSMLVALLIMVGSGVTLMGLAWLTAVLVFDRRIILVQPADERPEGTQNPTGWAHDLDEPGRDELAELVEPKLEDALEVVTHLISTHAAHVDGLIDGADLSGPGTGDGDDRRKGPPSDGYLLPRWERWQIQYNTTSLPDYAKQLDFFGIELGAAGGGFPSVDYTAGLAGARPKRRSGTGDQEKRLYFSWKSGKLRRFDRQLLAKAGIPTANRVLLQFVPKDVERTLASLERAYAKGREIREVKRTVFGVRQTGSRYDFFVQSMQFRSKAD